MNRNILVIAAAILGITIGWVTRTTTTDHRYIKALAERHEAERRYFDQKLDDMIQENKGNIYSERRNGNGTQTD